VTHLQTLDAIQTAKHALVLTLDKIIREYVVDALLQDGWKLSVDNGEEITVRDSVAADVIKAALGTVDDERLWAKKPHHGCQWVRFIYGECGHDVICDYTTGLTDIIDGPPMNEVVRSARG
jgi:hypothetical protein